jgi:hypothetical protein
VGVKVWIDRRALGQEAMLRAINVRVARGRDTESPLCVYDLAEEMGVTVRFVDINMEGMYDQVPKPRIHLSALRPLGRRAFNCAHELGHHVFGHGSSVDEMKANRWEPSTDPHEILADVFAGFLLMPIVGLYGAFVERGCSPADATPAQIYRIACNFGVGYATLVGHLAFGLHEIGRKQIDALRRSVPTIRREFLGRATRESLIVVDREWNNPLLDAEVGMLLLVPVGSVVGGHVLSHIVDLPGGRVFRTVRQGVTRITTPGSGKSVKVRVARRAYVGLARYRHLLDEDEIKDEALDAVSD